MTVAAVKGKLHEYIESVDEKKLQQLYALVENDIEDRTPLYDDATLASFRAASEGFASGKIKGFPMDESLSRLRSQVTQK